MATGASGTRPRNGGAADDGQAAAGFPDLGRAGLRCGGFDRSLTSWLTCSRPGRSPSSAGTRSQLRCQGHPEAVRRSCPSMSPPTGEVAAAAQEAARRWRTGRQTAHHHPAGASTPSSPTSTGTCGRLSATRSTGWGLTATPGPTGQGLAQHSADGGATSRGEGVGRAGRWCPSRGAGSRRVRRPAATRWRGW